MRSYTGADAAEIAVDKVEKSSKVAGGQLTREVTPKNSSDEDIVVPGTCQAPRRVPGGTTITLYT
jgi:hypothetical protein